MNQTNEQLSELLDDIEPRIGALFDRVVGLRAAAIELRCELDARLAAGRLAAVDATHDAAAGNHMDQP